MSTATLPAWSVIAGDAVRHRQDIHEHLRKWGAKLHVGVFKTACRLGVEIPHHDYPSMWLAAMDAAGRGYRVRLASVAGQASTQRDIGEAAADDLWDAVAAGWAFVRWYAALPVKHSPGVEHVIAELHAAGRWLANYPVSVARHDAEIANLFAVGSHPHD